ncbi:MAG: RNA polymerase factor sigma-54 [Lentimicrobiaceae bacterium]|nr:RNA polymerase factor sigma-54 [Lentimicrobiaceae bacterium]
MEKSKSVFFQTKEQEMQMQQRLSPRQILLMRLLQLPVLSLEQRIEQELHENPALELNEDEYGNEDSVRDDTDDDYFQESEAHTNETDSLDDFSKELNADGATDFNVDDFFADDFDSGYTPPTPATTTHKDEYPNRNDMCVSSESFHESLLAQLGMFYLSEEDKKIAVFLVGNIDESGYLTRSEENMVNDLLFSMNISTTADYLKKLITQIVHKFDPPGIGARNLRECLLIQLKRMDKKKSDVVLARKIIEKHYDEFTKKHFGGIKRSLYCSDKEFENAINCLLKLNPKPGAGFSHIENTSHIIPDFIVIVNDKTEQLELSLQGLNIPELRVGRMYQSLYKELQQKKAISHTERKEAMEFVRQKVNAARWFIDALSQREQTMYKTMEAIMNYQKEFFLTGEEMRLKPMVSKDIAQAVELDISTVSRVVRLKHVLTPYGVYPLKFFFSESMSKNDGEEVSIHEIKKIISDAVHEEDRCSPHTDTTLCNILNDKGYKIARRTVAKYREQMGLPVARLRKSPNGSCD